MTINLILKYKNMNNHTKLSVFLNFLPNQEVNYQLNL